MANEEYRDPVINPANDPALSPHAEMLADAQSADAALAERVEALRKTLSKLPQEITDLKNEQKSVWSWLKGGGVLIAFDLLVTIAGVIFGIYLHRVQNNNEALIEQVQNNQTRLNTSIHETCNLYGTFLGFYSDAAKARFVGGPAQYDQLYLTLQSSSDRLQCGTKHVVPRT
jgi:hypothetical protein